MHVFIFQICPAIDKVYPFSQLPAAFERMKAGHLRGKIVLNMEEEEGKKDH